MIRLVQPRRDAAESVVPMINVAFLLLIFFLMAAVIAPPEPVEVALPEADSVEGEADFPTLSITADGIVAREALRGAAALEGLSGQKVRVRADAELSAVELARLLTQLSEAGVADVELVTIAP